MKYLNKAENLGCGYYYDYPEIILGDENGDGSSGYSLFPWKSIVDYKYNKDIIIVKTIESKWHYQYWFIDKTIPGERLNYIDSGGYYRYSNISGPMDSLQFYQVKTKKGIKLNF